VIPDEAVEAVLAVLRRDDLWELSDREEAILVLQAAAPHLMAGVESVLAEWDAEAIGNRNTAAELRKAPRTAMNRNDIARHEQASVIAQNHATRIRNAIAGTS